MKVVPRIVGYITFQRLLALCEQLFQDLDFGPLCPFPSMITITLREPPEMRSYSDGDNIIIIVVFGLRFKFVLRWLCWYYVGCIGISLVALVFHWLHWYFIGNYPLPKC